MANIAEQAQKRGAVVDNVSRTRRCTAVAARRRHLVSHIDGQGRCSAAWCSGRKSSSRRSYNYLKHTGPSLSPFNAWVLLKGLETLPVRVERHIASAAAIADFLAARKDVARVYYPGRADHPQAALAEAADGAGWSAGRLRGQGRQGCLPLHECARDHQDQQQPRREEFSDHPATHTTHQRLAPEARAELWIFDNSVRLSVGLEHAGDLMAISTRRLPLPNRCTPAPCSRQSPCHLSRTLRFEC